MSGKFVRASKYRHVFGQPAKREASYENLKITKNAWDSNIISSNGKYLAVNWDASGGGAFAIIPLTEVGKAPDQVPLFRGHKGPVLDTVFNPFNKQQVVSCSDDGKACLWDIPEDYSFHDYTDVNDEIRDIVEPKLILKGHTRKVGHAEFHPCAENVLATSSMDYTVKIWNLETGKDVITLQHNDLVTSFCFNYNGSLLATTSRDKKLRIWDVRAGKIISEGASHTGAKPSRVTWLGQNDRVVTTGFSRLSDRQVGIWDINAIEKGPIDGFFIIDASSGVLIPYFDVSTSILYLAGKGDGNIRYFEYDNDNLHELSQYSSVDAQRGFAAAPKNSVNVKENEVLKAFKTVGDSSVEPISFIVPRRSELFQADIYPDCPSDVPALSATEWFAGKEVDGPLLMSLESVYDGTEPEIRESVKKVQKKEEPKVVEKVAEKVVESKASTPAPETPKTPQSIDELLKTDDKVNNLLDKVDDDKDHDEEPKGDEENDDWEEIKKPAVVDAVPIKTVKYDLKPEPKEAKAEKTETKEPVEPVQKSEPKEAEPVEKKTPEESPKPKETTPEPVASPVPAPVSTPVKSVSPAPVATPVKADAAPVSTPVKATGAPTLKATVEKLAGLVLQLEAQVTKLTEASLEKDAGIAELQKKVDELLKK